MGVSKMKVISTAKDMQELSIKLQHQGKTIGFVPTMGFLHEGHLALLKQARAENDIVVLSIFVNPTQFGPNEDFDTYPRDFERDERLAKAEAADYLFYPSVAEMYPGQASVSISVIDRVDVLCGAKRPGHFDGVATVLTKLFHLVQPNRAYFGKKDAQQVAVVHGLITDFKFPIELVAVDTVREEDGLAKSSRNVNLLDSERKEAPALYQSLQKAKQLIESGERDVEMVKMEIERTIKKNTSGTIDYVAIYSYPELKPLDKLDGQFIIAIAIQFSKARLIDNIIMEI